MPIQEKIYLRLLQAASLKKAIVPVTRLKKPPEFEFAVAPPKAYLTYLLNNLAERSRLTSDEISAKDLSENTKEKRLHVLNKNLTVLREAQNNLQISASPGNWWVLEGNTMVDCALFFENATVFIEGKRTEKKLTDDITWDKSRSQIGRLLEGLQGFPCRTENYYVLLIVDDDPRYALPLAQELDNNLEFLHKSWPHRTTPEREEMVQHYLGYITWQACAELAREITGQNINYPHTRNSQ